MKPSLSLGIELPPVPAGGGRGGPPVAGALEAWRQMAAASVAAGARTVWTAGSGADGYDPETPWCDACTLAGGLAQDLQGASIGVVSPVPGGRHPSVLARDVTTLDVVSGGRAALQVRWAAPPPTDLTVACEHLADAVAVCAAMLRGGDPVHDGRHFRVSGAMNRPAPRQEGGPPIVVASPGVLDTELAAAAGRRPGRLGTLARRTAVLADAITCRADPAVVAAWRALLTGGDHRDTGSARQPAIVCRVRAGEPVVPDAHRAERVTAPDEHAPHLGRSRTALGTPAAVRSASAQARDAGATGVIVVLEPGGPWGRGMEGAPGGDAVPGRAVAAGADTERLVRLVAAAFTPWTGSRP